METELTFLGGAQEIGANSCYLNCGGTGIIIDSGLHPQKRNASAFPRFNLVANKPFHSAVITHAHTDHIGSLPYLIKNFPHAHIHTTWATRDISEIMLRDASKLLLQEISEDFPLDAIEAYNQETLEKLTMIISGHKYHEPFVLKDFHGEEVKVTLFDAGHILGSAGVLLETCGKAIFHTGDVQFRDQMIIPGASFPRHHVDVLIIESTNCSDDELPDSSIEQKRLARFINEIVNEGGSVLLPCFALGRTQEVLKILHNLMKLGTIPKLPIYTGGMGKNISNIYDRLCYTTPRIEPGFEVADVPQVPIDYKNLLSDDYFKSPSIVVASSGMMNEHTISFNLAKKWMEKAHFGIGFVGYITEDTPGYELLHSERKKPFTLAGVKTKRLCRMELFHFSAHAKKDDLVEFACDVTPNIVFVVHGSEKSCETLAAEIKLRLPQTKIYIPKVGVRYSI